MMPVFFSPLAGRVAGICLVLSCLSLIGCGDDEAQARAAAEATAQRQRAAIERVLAVDASIAKVRDRDKGTGQDINAVSGAVTRYTDALEAIDMTDVPEDVKAAFAKHAGAWRAAAKFFANYTGLSGSFRKGFDGAEYIRSQGAVHMTLLEDSWQDVKAKAKAHGAAVPE